MPKFMIEASYTLDGVNGVLKGGGTARKTAVQAAAKSVGGKLESFYFCFGKTDAFAIVDLPDNTAAADLALTISGSGAASVNTVVLLTPDEIDAAADRGAKYRPPGT